MLLKLATYGPYVTSFFLQLALVFAIVQRRLWKRLNGVLRNEPEEASSAPDSKRTVVNLAIRINESSDKLHEISKRLNSILRRLEI